MGIFISCSSNKSSSFESGVVELKDYKTLVTIEDTTIAVPSVIKYDGTSNLFVYDKKKGSILELNGSDNVVKEYGRRGRGPGEFLWVNNMFLTENHLYVVDSMQFLIHKFKQGDGLISSMDYGRIVGSPNIPSAPISSSSIYAENINNQPFVTQNGNVLLSAVGFSENIQAIYELRNWEGDYIADVGEIPKGSSFVLDYDNLHTDVDNREVPAFYKSNVFPVSDQANQGEYFLIYNALPLIAKYNDDGQKLWESDIPATPETDSIKKQFYKYMDQQSSSRSRIILKYYVSGIGDSQGNLYLATDSSPIWIHRFNTKGEITRRYKMISEDVGLVPIFDIDISGNRIFIVTEEGGIRTYSLSD